MLSDYTDLEKQIKEAPEPKVLPRGTEVKARIISINEGVSDKNDCDWHMPTFDVPADPMVIEFNDFFWELDQTKLEPKQFQRALYKFQRFATSFGINFSRPFSWDDLIGNEGWLIVGIQKDEEYGDKNRPTKYVVPKGKK